MVDARWLGRGGPGRVTEHLLRGLVASPPDGGWMVWGDVPATLQWPGLVVETAKHDPHDWYGQRDLVVVPHVDRALWLHQYRPLRRSATVEVGMVYDTIPLRWGAPGPVRVAMRQYFRRVVTLPDRLITVSDFSKRALIEDLGVEPTMIDVIVPPADVASIERVVAMRRHSSARPHVLFIGRFAPHKNLDRLVEAFRRTAFSARGGRLVLVGGTPDEVDRLDARMISAVDVRHPCSQGELEQLLAAAAALVQPSLEEGYGLPVVEALAAGVPVAAAAAGALPEVARGRAVLFDPFLVDGIASAIDAAVRGGDVAVAPLDTLPTPEHFAEQVIASLDRAMADGRRRR